MKHIIASFLLFFTLSASSQDTINKITYYDKVQTFWVVSKKDTMMYSKYPNGKKASEIKYNITGSTIIYKRWYENGKLMWEREMVNNKAEGKTTYYDSKGIKIAELNFEKGELKDTVFIKDGIHLVLGKITSRSVVYGGMVREDGTSNISEYNGPWMYCSMYAAKVDSIKKPVLVQNFRSDHNGDFFIVSPEGSISFFQSSTPIEKLNPGEFYPPQGVWSSGHEGWNMTGPQIIKKEDQLLFVHLHHESVGYAP